MLFLPDGFTTTSIFDKSQGGTTNANGAYFTVAGVGIDQYMGKAQTFINGFKKAYNIKDVQPYAILAAQAAQVLLDAIEKSDGSRAAGDQERLQHARDRRPDRQLLVQQERRPVRGNGPVARVHRVRRQEQHAATIKTTTPPTNLVEAARRAGATAS